MARKSAEAGRWKDIIFDGETPGKMPRCSPSSTVSWKVIDPGGVPWVDVSMNKDLHACTYILIDRQ